VDINGLLPDPPGQPLILENRMTHWPQVRLELQQALADQLIEFDADFLSFEFRNDGRAQRVFLTHHEGTNRAPWIRVESGFAGLESEAILAGIQHVGQEDCLGIGLGRIEDNLTIRWTSFIEGLTLDRLVAMVAAVANHADGLEADLSEVDSY
jgi:hypothetical protein